MARTSDFYIKNAQAFYESTITVDAEALYRHFLPLLPAGGHILDAGCGSGRDALAFLQKGFQISAFDACHKIILTIKLLLK